MKDLTTILRELARSNKYQSIYANEKPIGLKLFKNDFDYSDLQINFLGYLSFYHSIYYDIAMGEVNKIILDDFMYEEAYMIYRNKKRKEEVKENKDNKKDTKNKTHPKETATKSQWIFRKPKGKK